MLTYHTLQWQLTKYAIMADQSTDKCNVTVTKILNVVHGVLTTNKSLWSHIAVTQVQLKTNCVAILTGRCVKIGLNDVMTSRNLMYKKTQNTTVYCGHTAGWIKMPLGMEVGLGPGHIVLLGPISPSQKRRQSPLLIFGPFLLWPSGCMYQDTTWYGGTP